MDKNIQKIKPSGIFTNYIYKAIPLAFDESMSYYETLCGILSLLKTQEEVINNNADLILELELYMKNYFKNLDVQTEINNKLDEMAESGQLSDIIAQYINLTSIFTFNNINELITSNNLNNNSKAIVLGKNDYTDGGYKTFIIKDITDMKVDNKNVYKLANNKYAILVNKSIFKNDITYKRFRYNNTNCFIVNISKYDNYLKQNKIKVGIANDYIGDNHFESTMNYAKRKNTTLCTNAGIFNADAPYQIWGACIIDGKIIVNNPIPVDDPGLHYLTIDADNHFGYTPLETSASTMIANGVKYAVAGFFPIINDGKIISHTYPWVEGNQPRQIWCENYDGSQFIFACEGRLYENVGLTFSDIQSYLLNNYPNIKFAMAMDGGGSLSINVYKQKLNKSLDDDLTKDREVPYFLYLANEDAENTEQNDLNKTLNVMSEQIYNLQTQLNTLRNLYTNNVNILSNELYPHLKVFTNGNTEQVTNQLSFERGSFSVQATDSNNENLGNIFIATKLGLYDVDGLLGKFMNNARHMSDCNSTELLSGIYSTDNNTLNNPSPDSPVLYFKYLENQIIEIFFNTSNYSPLLIRRYNGTNWSDPYPAYLVCSTGDRSFAYKGMMMYDTTLNKPIWYNGTNWIDASGNTV